MRKEELGIGDILDEGETKEIMEALEEFSDWCISCSLMDPTTRDIVMEVNKHQHFTKSCRKKGPKCKYGFPRLPTTKTVISVPSRIIFKDDEAKEKEMLEKSNKIKKKMEEILEDEVILDSAKRHRQKELEEHIMYHGYLEEIESIKQYEIYCKYNSKPMFKPTISEGCLQSIEMDLDEVMNTSMEHLSEIQNLFKEKMLADCTIAEIKNERLDILLRATNIDGNSFEERNAHYMDALKISSRGYSVILKRDVDETMINNYNPEWIKAWSGNMDM